MFRLLILLCGVMFLTLQFGGQDRGQLRQGLMNVPAPVAAKPKVAEASTKPVVTFASMPLVESPKPVIEAAPKIELPATAVEQAAPVPDEILSVLYVKGNSINVRGGPSTNDTIVGRLTRNEAVSVVSAEVDGWVQIRIEGDGIEGYVAARLLTDLEPGTN